MASLLDPYSPTESAPAAQPGQPAALPPIPGIDLPLGTNPALAAHQMAARNYAGEGLQQQGQQTQMRVAQQGRQAAAEIAAFAANPANAKTGWNTTAPEIQQHFISAYPDIAPQIPGIFNTTQSAAAGRPVGVNVQTGEQVSAKGPDGSTFENVQPTPQEGQSAGALGDQDQQWVNSIAHYSLPYASLQALARKQPQRYEQLLNAVSQVNPNFDANQYSARQGLMKSYASGPDAANRTSANTLIGHLDQMLQAGQNLNNRGFTPWNAVANEAQSLTGNPNQVTFKQTADAVATELSKLFKGTGAASDSEIKEWRQTLSPNASPEQIKASAATALGLMQSRLDALRDKYQTGMGEEPPPMLSKESQAILQKRGLYTPGGQSGAEPTAPPSQQETPKINSQQEYDALPKGAKYVDSAGRTGVKK